MADLSPVRPAIISSFAGVRDFRGESRLLRSTSRPSQARKSGSRATTSPPLSPSRSSARIRRSLCGNYR